VKKQVTETMNGMGVKLEHGENSTPGTKGTRSIMPRVARTLNGSEDTAGKEEEDLEVPCNGAGRSKCDREHWTDSEVARLRGG